MKYFLIGLLTFSSLLANISYGHIPSHTLKSAAEKRGFQIGTFSWSPSGPSGFSAAYDQFNVITLPVYFRQIESEKGKFDFTFAERIGDAAPKDVKFFVPALIWNELIPDWLKNGKFSGEELKEIMVEYITTVMNHLESKYPGRIIGWEVSSEVMSWQGPGGFWHKIGLDAGKDQYEYIRVAHRAARATLPNAKLQIEDFAVEDLGTRSNAFFDLVKSLKEENVPIDQVGFEGHFMLKPEDASMTTPLPDVPSVEVLKKNQERYALLGLEVMYTQVDIAILDKELSSPTLAKQAESYQRLFRACLETSGCTTISTWGIGDSDSWIPKDAGDAFVGWGSPLLFDKSYTTKPAYTAVLNELLRDKFKH